MSVQNAGDPHVITPRNPSVTNIEENTPLHERIANKAKAIFTSPLFWVIILSLTLLTLTGFSLVSLTTPYAITGTSVLATSTILDIAGIGGIIISYKKQIMYEVSLAATILRNKRKPDKYPCWTRLDDNIYLGSIPLKSRRHLSEIRALGSQDGIAILSMVEPWEMKKDTLFSSPVSEGDWRKAGVSQMTIPSIDFEPPTIKELKKAVKFIDEQIRQGKKVYVHCKAGRGRSACSIAAHYIAKKGWTAEDAIAFISGKRSFVSLNKQNKIDRLKAFEEHVRESSSLASSNSGILN